MKNKFYLIFLLFFLIIQFNLPAEKSFINDEYCQQVQRILSEKFPQENDSRIRRGIKQVALFWKSEDGSSKEFSEYCQKYFVPSGDSLEKVFKKLETYWEVISGYFHEMRVDLLRPLHLNWGDIHPIDMAFGQFNPGAHLFEDLFKNKIAFFILLNFPHYSLAEKMELGSEWSRQQWAYARVGDFFTSRTPASVNQKITAVMTDADTYISEYNIYVGKLVDKRMKTYFPADLKLITHWNLRDELKSRYNDPKGFFKQKMIFAVMEHIILQDIPEIVINNPDYNWNPFSNRVYKKGRQIKYEKEGDTRYNHLLNIFQAIKLSDAHNPYLPSYIKRKFESEREIPEEEVDKLFRQFISAKVIRKVARLIGKRLKRRLQPFDIWYNGFRTDVSIPLEKLDKIVSEKYPKVENYQTDIYNILLKLDFSQEQAEFISPKIRIDSSRGIGHSIGSAMKSAQARVRTRVLKTGMNYKGYNIAMHELGHAVEQTLTLHKVDYYSLTGVPNTAFTEAFAYVFQDRDFDLLGIKRDERKTKYLRALDSLWNAYEIMGVSLVDMGVWNWLYDNPEATAEQLKDAVISIAKEIWNKYYADVFKVRDQIILAIYSHMIDAALYLPDYPLGHIIQFQIETYLEGKKIGQEMERMCSSGNIIPQLWMKQAVGSKISITPLLIAAEEALHFIKK